jgi:hypothetical protein
MRLKMQSLLLTTFSWLSHFSQSYILLKCNKTSSNECLGTSISESMVFPTCVNDTPNRYDFVAFIAIHLVFTKFVYMMYYIYTHPEMLFHNSIIDTGKKQRSIRYANWGIALSNFGIYLMYFTTFTNDPLQGHPSDVRETLTDLHIFCVVMIVLGTSLLSVVMVKNIHVMAYTITSIVYFVTLVTTGSIAWHLYNVHGYEQAMQFMNIGEFEILYFTFVYYLFSIRTYEVGRIHKTVSDHLIPLGGIFFLNSIVGPIVYSCLNCYL